MHSSFSSEKNKPNLYLVGMMGTGKSTIGKVLADQLSMNFIDSDESIEESSGQSISEIFTQKGKTFSENSSKNLSRVAIRIITLLFHAEAACAFPQE
jgi:shikimate kinase